MNLGVNIDHVATLRQARRGQVPDPIIAAQTCEKVGTASIVCHLRQDRRHINDHDLEKLRQIVTTKLNLEMSCTQEIVDIALEVLPDQATLVPEKREEVTTEGGLDVIAHHARVAQVVKSLSLSGIMVSLFIDPEKPQIEAAKQAGASCIELHTGKYANARNQSEAKRELEILKESVKLARNIGLQVFAGHGLNYENVKKVTEIEEIEELNIGHSIISRAVFVGIECAVKEMLTLVK
ncbi:MAG: pyridoxine 5'-phosphate synthase [Omnitrophica bacterium]|nr:pyridoxine 5'-phosphate synthase [Candidatus Omnitrophota bacterium]